ncbi:fructose-1,6-bisphosphate aldolase, class II [Candidatus Mycoplasma haematolamae str. Purdue]|uniref:Fructose-1,6-bisphosphate aldolase, class II n=1 Tax=Mycoplasma haematolamae (strain Purdue) TaxID=1212765 RepID=I7B9V6_MYCHA|nr:class II fructose-1,6-bisphosphate aldolase [Candidatus Mycoplasma haematolamae]AFO52050.1 fructose-1,6-bisphosphate aldolase, class II [Candidatus Mycoplasma haematolamae str. Purdue]
MPLVNAVEVSRKALEGKYAIAQINTNNLEWTKAILLTAEKCKSPVIVGASEGAIKYMGGFNVVSSLVSSMVKDLNISVPVILHLDHGTYEGCKKALEANFSSVMFDGSHFPFEENYQKSKEIIELATAKGVSVEVEVGTLAGEEDGVMGLGNQADVNECVKISELKPTLLAAGIGNMHGPYPPNWKGLNLKLLEEISNATKAPLVLHGGTGIDDETITKAISLGVTKINVNTELQMRFAAETRKYVEAGKDQDMKAKGFDPRKLLAPGYQGILDVIETKFKLFGSVNKA